MNGNKVFCKSYFDAILLLCLHSYSSFPLLTTFRLPVTDWNILNGEQMKEIASKVPTTSDELAECMVPEHFQKEYGERLLKNINAYIESENLRDIIEKQPRKKQKRKGNDAADQDVIVVDDDEFDDGIDYAAIEMPGSQNSGKQLSSSSGSKMSNGESKKSSYFPKRRE
jgi:hypothetical protein